MSDLMKTLSLVAMIAMAPAAFAQTDSTGDAPQTDEAQTEGTVADGVDESGLSMGEEVGADAESGIGSTYVSAEHGDWEVRCVRAAEGDDPCQLYQLLSDEGGNAVAEISMFSVAMPVLFAAIALASSSNERGMAQLSTTTIARRVLPSSSTMALAKSGVCTSVAVRDSIDPTTITGNS